MSRRTIYVKDPLWTRAAKRASEVGLSVSAVVRLLLQKWLNGEIEIDI